MTDEQKAALDLAILNLRTHGDDQLLSAVQPLIEFYESRVLAERKEPCGGCGGTGHMVRDPDIGTDQECFACDGSGIDQFTHPTPDDASIQERIPKGWCLYACDFSIQGSPGSVTLKRDKEGVSWWFSLPEYRREKTDLFLYGRGKTIEEALDAAIDRARQSGEEGK
jgi:hypothetical protein